MFARYLALFLSLSLSGLNPMAAAAADWETSTDFAYLGDPGAKKGGTLVAHWPSFPPTLRTEGPNANLSTTASMHSLIFESLVSLHPETLEYVPRLAEAWKISEDKRTFTFRINPKAKWSDGSPVTARDVVATWEWLTRKDIKDPYANLFASENFEKPTAESERVVSVKTKKLHWRLFYYFGGMNIYPASEMSKLDGTKYLEDYNFKTQMGSGPYHLAPDGVKKEHSVTVERRPDYWGENERFNTGLHNFDRISWLVVMDDELAFEKFKKGEIDVYQVLKAQRWAEETDFDKIKMGWVQKRKIYTKGPQGISGFAFNMRRPPFDDRNMRKAFAYLFNRKRLIEKLFFSEYDFIDSYFPGSVWANPDNPKIRYNPRLAARLLERAGYKERNADGWLVKDGKPLELTLEYSGGASWTRIHKVIKEDMEKAGIKLELREIDPRTLMKKVDERNFSLHMQAWTGLVFPNPEGSWSSKLADEKHNTNVTGFKDPEVDKLVVEYDLTFDRKRQIEIIRKIDRLIFRQHPYALGWYANFTRLVYWDKFGHPKTYFSKLGDERELYALWWADPDREKAMTEARAAGRKIDIGPTVIRPWK